MNKNLIYSFLIVVTAIACRPSVSQAPLAVVKSAHATEKAWYPVKKIVDGDTFWVDDGSEKGLKIRFIGIDAPESRRTGKKEIGYYHAEATAYLSSLIEGREVRLEYDVRRYDQYGRTLAYVYLQDGRFVNAELLKNGCAVLMTTPPNINYVDSFVVFQQQAQEQRIGLWNQREIF